MSATGTYVYYKIEEQKSLIKRQEQKIENYKKLQRLEMYKTKDPKFLTDLEKKMKEINDNETKKNNLLHKNFLETYTEKFDIETLANNLRTNDSFYVYIRNGYLNVDKEIAARELENYWKPKGIRKIEVVEEYYCNDGCYHKIIWYR